MAPDTVFFLSDYGTQDEFVGVVHAVVHAAAPGVAIIDLTHQVPPFDIRAGADALVRAVPYLGAGVVLAVVDPGVGSGRRGLCIEVAPSRGGPAFLVGPDNGLLIPAAELGAAEAIVGAFELARVPGPTGRGPTFDGRDLFAPAVAALCRGAPARSLGNPIEAASLVRLPRGPVERGRLGDGRAYVRAQVTWVDHFGNLQLAATFADAQVAGVPLTGKVCVSARELARPLTLRCVGTFDDLAQGEPGLLIDSHGHLAVVAGRASAALLLGVGAGELLTLAW